MIRLLVPCLLFLASGCLTQIQTSAFELPQQQASQVGETSTSIAAATPLVGGKSTQEVLANAGDGKAMNSLDTYKWKNRLLLVFAPSENSPVYQRQMQLFEGQKAGFDDRNLLVVKVIAKGTSYIDSQSIDETAAANLRSRFNVGQEDFHVILVGKDGTEKRRDSAPVEPKVIFNEIDAMPMRQQEMRSKEQQQ